ncbi:MAG: hypothetical protein L3J20_04255 [Flavobacteriaceae bacterium]|nr:hypothetical protein [Flavobacteriaceae bacterium]
MKGIICIFLILIGFSSHAQKSSKNFRIKTIQVVSDTIQIDSVSISPYNFKVFNHLKQQIDTTDYNVDFAKAQLILNKKKYQNIIIEYNALPEFLTKVYTKFDKNLIVPKATDLSRLYSVKSRGQKNRFIPFDGLNTSGSISRGLTIGNNQDAVVNSNLDLQISGNLSEKVKIRASITDTNVPLQENGFTQRLDEFDRVFIELYSKNWSVKAGDIDFTNTENYFMRFNKKVAGVKLDAVIDKDESETRFFASGALVRGEFARNTFFGQEGNQGPYKITSSDTLGEQFILLISGSETVYVNGIPLRRGENNDYIIDYNTAELIFNPTYPVTANMRITVEYQFSERNYTRFVTYNGAEYQTEKLKIGISFYNENDAKNQTLQQDLNNNQKEILSFAGDDVSQMVVPSAFADVFSENKILYKKELQNGIDTFIFSNDPDDDLFTVRFTFVGQNNGNYNIQTTIASGRIYEYIAPIGGVAQGLYEPIVQLIAPNKLQIAVLNADYSPNNKTIISSEFAYSDNDLNLFSSFDDGNNQGFAGKINWKQTLLDKTWKLKSAINYEYITKNFKTIERFRNVEFIRDWDLVNPLGDQQFFTTSLSFENDEKGNISYTFDQLNFSENFTGNKHNFLADLKLNNTKIKAKGSFLNNDSETYKTQFSRWYSNVNHHFNKSWVGVKLNAESNERKDKNTQIIADLSHKFLEYEGYVGVGDTAKVYVEIGYNYRTTDSLQLNKLQRVNDANTYFLRSKLIQNKTADLSLFINYRTVDNVNIADEESLNSRISYRQQLFKNAISLQTVYETSSGTLPQQEFSYIEVDTGLGFYTWNDYNNNGIQELDEFEIAQFQDEANYVRVLLPTINFIKTNQNKFSQSLTIHPSSWANQKGFKKLLSHFTNQSFILIDSKKERLGADFDFNPFAIKDNVLALNMNIKNSLFYNRGKQKYSTTYTYLKSRNKTAFSIGDQENNLTSHQLLFSHKKGKFWLFDVKGAVSKNRTESQNFTSRNFLLDNYEMNPKLSYLYNNNSRFEVLYNFKNKENQVNGLETLQLHDLGVNFIYARNQKFSINTSLNYIVNNFEGNLNSPVAYQMLEGLQPGTNYTWNLTFQKKITSYLDINFNYLGRKSETAKAVHTGNLQLRASF